MAETKQIAEIASKVSNDIFCVFGWVRSDGPEDVNFSCDRMERHQRIQSKTHPVDCVFRYNDPYTKQPIYFIVDLKSYGEGTITKSKVSTAIRNLCASVECAQTSKSWKERYVDQGDATFRVHGILFVYNHDGDYRGDFTKAQQDVIPDTLPLPGASRVYVFGPADISYLRDITNHFYKIRAELGLKSQKQICAIHADQQTRFSPQIESQVTQIEDLLGPFMIYRVVQDIANADSRLFLVYCKSSGYA